MRYLFLTITGLLFVLNTNACSCSPFSFDFYLNIGENCDVRMLRIDSVWNVTDSLKGYYMLPFAQMTVIKDYKMNSNPGDILIFKGTDGVDCEIGYNQSQENDTIVAIVNYLSWDSTYAISVWSNCHCGWPYITIENGQHDGRNLDEIDARVNQFLTSVYEEKIMSAIHYWPNPVSDFIHLKLTDNPSVIVDCYDQMGRKIEEFSITQEENSFDVSHFKSGMYFLMITDGISRKTLRFIKD